MSTKTSQDKRGSTVYIYIYYILQSSVHNVCVHLKSIYMYCLFRVLDYELCSIFLLINMIYSTLYADLLFAYTFTLLLHQRKKLYYIFGLSKSHCHCLYLSVCLFAILSVNFTLLFTITHHRFQLEKLICTKHAS